MDRKSLTKFKRAFGKLSDAELAERFGIPLEEVHALGTEHALGKDKRVFPCADMPRWSDEEVARLSSLYPVHSNEEIATLLGRTAASIVTKAYRMRLEKSSEHISEVGRENISVRWEENSQARE